MFKIRMAGLNVEIHNRYAYTEERCDDYRVADDLPTDVYAAATEDEITEELALAVSAKERDKAESICVYRRIAAQLYRFDALLMHGAVIGYDGGAYAFLAPSGTGKSTHIRLWRRYLGDAILPVNGDKPILRPQNGIFMANGTPWAGKEGWQRNISLPLKGVCFLTRGSENTICRLTPGDAVPLLLRQIYLPPEPEGALETMALSDRLVNEVPVYLLACNMTEDAVKTSFEAMTGHQYTQVKGTNV